MNGAATCPLRVLLVTGAYAPELSSGGLQAQMVARVLRDRVNFRVLTTAVDRTLAPHATVEGVPVSRIGIDVASTPSKVAASVNMLRELPAVMRGVDVVHIHGYSQKNVPVTAMAKALRVPIVLSLHTAGFDEPDTIRRQGSLAQWAFNSSDLYLAVSAPLVDACAAAGLPSNRVRHVPNGVDVERFRPAAEGERAALRRSLGLAEERPVVLFVGFFSREKQPHVLLDAWLALQARGVSSTLLLVGAARSSYFEVDNQLADDMRERARRAGVLDGLTFVPPTSRVDDYYRAANVFVLPSSREGLPVVLLEAMATALPVVASRLPGATDVVIDDGNTGILTTPGSVDELAAAIQVLLSDRAKASAMGSAARNRVARDFSADRTAHGWLDAYQTVARP